MGVRKTWEDGLKNSRAEALQDEFLSLKCPEKLIFVSWASLAIIWFDFHIE